MSVTLRASEPRWPASHPCWEILKGAEDVGGNDRAPVPAGAGLGQKVLTLVFNPQTDRVAMGFATGLTIVQNIPSSGYVVYPGEDRVSALAFSASGQILAIAEQNNPYVRLWDTNEQTKLGEFRAVETGSISAMSFLESDAVGAFVALDASRTAHYFDRVGGPSRHQFYHRFHCPRLWPLFPSPLVIAGGDGGINLEVWMPSERKTCQFIKGSLATSDALMATPSGNFIASVGSDQTLRIWKFDFESHEWKDYRALRHPEINPNDSLKPMSAVAVSDDGAYAVSAKPSAPVFFWDVEEGRGIYRWNPPEPVISARFIRDRHSVILVTETGAMYQWTPVKVDAVAYK